MKIPKYLSLQKAPIYWHGSPSAREIRIPVSTEKCIQLLKNDSLLYSSELGLLKSEDALELEDCYINNKEWTKPRRPCSENN